MGANGMNGQTIRRTRPTMPLTNMMAIPAISRISLETKPTHLEMRRSVKAWNFNSKEASLVAEPAEIWRYGWNSVRMSEDMEKKSARLRKLFLSFSAKAPHPDVNHQDNNSTIIIRILYQKNKTLTVLFLATIFEARMFAFVAVFVVIVAILFCNRFHSEFSCHVEIITWA